MRVQMVVVVVVVVGLQCVVLILPTHVVVPLTPLVLNSSQHPQGSR